MDYVATGQNNDQPHDIIFCRAVADGADAACVVADHAADRSRGARVGWKEKSIAGERFVEFLVNHTSLNIHLEIFRTDSDNVIHLIKIDDHSALHRDGITFQTGSGSPRGDRHFILACPADKTADLLGGVWPDHNIRKSRCMK